MTVPFYLDTTLQTEAIAKELLGYLLVHEAPEGRTSGWIVEVEAYLGSDDRAAHTYNQHRSDRVEAMYGPPGHFYIYQQRHHYLMNMVTQQPGNAQGVLIRAIEVYEGETLMEARRQGQVGYQLTNGPAKLTQAMGIDKDYYGQSVTGGDLYIDFTQKRQPKTITTSPRIGIPNAEEWRDKPLRFFVEGNPYVSHRKGKIAENNGWVNGCIG